MDSKLSSRLKLGLLISMMVRFAAAETNYEKFPLEKVFDLLGDPMNPKRGLSCTAILYLLPALEGTHADLPVTGRFLFDAKPSLLDIARIRRESSCTTIFAPYQSNEEVAKYLEAVFNSRIVLLLKANETAQLTQSTLNGQPHLLAQYTDTGKIDTEIVCPKESSRGAGTDNKPSLEMHVRLLRLSRSCSTDAFYERQGSLHVVAILASPPLYQFGKDGAIDDGLTVRLMSVVAQKIGARELSFAPSARRDFGEAGNMSSGIDVTLMPLGMNSKRCRIEGGFLYGDDQVVAMKVPEPLPQFMNLVYPFDNTLWIMLVTSIFVLVVTSIAISSLRNNEFVIEPGWNVFAILFNESKQLYLRSSSGPQKTINIFWMFACLLLVSSYQGNLRASLVVRPYTKLITQLSQILVEDISFYAATNFKFFHEWGNSYAAIDRQLYQHVLKKESGYDYLGYNSTFEMLDRVRQETGTAVGIAKSRLLLYEQRAVRDGEDMPFRAVNQRVLNHDNYLCTPKYRWWRGEDRMYQILTRMVEGGINAHTFDLMFPFHHLFISNGQRGERNPNAEEQRMPPESLYVILGLVGILFGFAVTIFMIEIGRKERLFKTFK